MFTSKPIEPTPSTLKADLAAFVNSNMLITKIIGKNAQWLCVSSTSASKFEIPIDAYELILASIGISNFEADVLESTYSRALLPMIFVISIFELTKTARSALKVEKQVGSVYLLNVKKAKTINTDEVFEIFIVLKIQ